MVLVCFRFGCVCRTDIHWSPEEKEIICPENQHHDSKAETNGPLDEIHRRNGLSSLPLISSEKRKINLFYANP